MSWFAGDDEWIEVVFGLAEEWLHAHAPTSRLAVERDPGVNHVVGLLVRVAPDAVTARQAVDLRGHIRQSVPLDVWVRVSFG